MRPALISPRLALQKGDFLGSGIPYWPLELAILAGYLRDRGDEVSVLDLFGREPRQIEERVDHYLQGVRLANLADTAAIARADLFVVYAISYMSFVEQQEIVQQLKVWRPEVPVLVLENSQAVTSYALDHVRSAFFAAGADLLVCGEPYSNWDEITKWLDNQDNGDPPDNTVAPTSAGDRPVKRRRPTTSSYAIPAWELFDLKNYWSLPYAHGPKSAPYLPFLASRGCTYPCDFCVVPTLSGRRWQPRSPEDVVEEFLFLRDRFGVRHFHIEDLNPTIHRAHWRHIAELLIQRRADIIFYFASGTKAETIAIEDVPLLAAAGCRFISFSPESGSPELMKAIGKPFDHNHGLALVRACHEHGVRTQACFIVGHPSESNASHTASTRYLRQLVEAGLDEVAIFIVAAFAGSKLFFERRLTMKKGTLPSFSPRGQANFELFSKRRSELIRVFFTARLRRGFGLWAQGIRALTGRPQTKMENLPRRVVFVAGLLAKFKLRKWRCKGND